MISLTMNHVVSLINVCLPPRKESVRKLPCTFFPDTVQTILGTEAWRRSGGGWFSSDLPLHHTPSHFNWYLQLTHTLVLIPKCFTTALTDNAFLSATLISTRFMLDLDWSVSFHNKEPRSFRLPIRHEESRAFLTVSLVLYFMAFKIRSHV